MCLHPVTEPPEMGESLFFPPSFFLCACSTLPLKCLLNSAVVEGGPLVMSDPSPHRSLVCFAPRLPRRRGGGRGPEKLLFSGRYPLLLRAK